MLLLSRPACWKRSRAITGILALGALCFSFSSLVVLPIGPLLTLLGYPGILSGSLLTTYVLFLLGLLLLLQAERVQKQAQQAARPAP
jgi:hypothetical protein